MKLINNNLKTVGYINAVLIVIAIVIRVFGSSLGDVAYKVDAVICILALIAGLIYSLMGYTKAVANYYKVFMLLYAISSAESIIPPVVGALNAGKAVVLLFALVPAIIMICALILAFAKDLGKEKSTTLSWIILSVSIVKVVLEFCLPDGIHHLAATIAYLIQAIIAFVFVSAKYADKASRGAK